MHGEATGSDTFSNSGGGFPPMLLERKMLPLSIIQLREPMANRSAEARGRSRRISTPAPPSPWRGRQGALARDSKRDAVILTAARAFNNHGYHNTSLDDIAAELQVTKPTLYYYVKNKEQLLFECFRTGLEPIRAAFNDIGHSRQCARERLTLVLLRYAEAIASEFGWCMVRAEDLNLSAERKADVKALKSEIDQGIRRLIREGIADKSIAPCDPKMTAFALAGALNWIAHWYRDNQALNSADIARAFVDIFDHGLRPRDAPAAPRS
jgi:AcrR family transcriptional regulator